MNVFIRNVVSAQTDQNGNLVAVLDVIYLATPSGDIGTQIEVRKEFASDWRQSCKDAIDACCQITYGQPCNEVMFPDLSKL